MLEPIPDIGVNLVHTYGITVIVLHTAYMTHGCTKHWTKILQLMSRLPHPAPRPIVLRHLFLVLMVSTLSLLVTMSAFAQVSEEYKGYDGITPTSVLNH